MSFNGSVVRRGFVEQGLELPSGVLLITGPTGSGKTSTVYSCINKINSPQIALPYPQSIIPINPLFESLREDEEFKAIIKRQEKKYADIRAELDKLREKGLL